MPTVPGIQQPISLDVPGVQVPPSLAGPAAAARLGQTLEESSLALLDKVKQAEAIDTSSRAYFQDRYNSEDYITQLKLKYPDGYVTDSDGKRKQNENGSYRTITQEYRDWSNDRYQNNQNDMPTEAAKQLYTQKSGQYFNDSILKVRSDELIARTDSFSQDQADRLRFSQNRLVDIPSVRAAYSDLDTFTAEYKGQEGVLLSQKQVRDATTKLQAEVPQALFQGFFNGVLAEPKRGESRQQKILDALDVLHGADPDSASRHQMGLKTFSEAMSPDQKAHFEAELLRLQKVAKSLDASEWHQAATTANHQIDSETHHPGQTGVRQPIPFDYLFTKGLELMKQRQAEGEGGISELDFTQTMGQVVAADAGGKIFSSPAFLLASPKDKEKYIEQAIRLAHDNFQKFATPELLKNIPYFDANFRNKLVDDLSKISDDTDKSAHKDFADFSMFDPTVKTRTAQLDQTQAFINPQTLWKTGRALKERNDKIQGLGDTYFGFKSPDFRLITSEESQQLAEYIKSDIHAHSSVADGLMALYNSDRKHYASIVDQMIRDKNLTPEWRLVLGVTPNRTLTAEVVRTIKDQGPIRAEAEKYLRDRGQSSEAIDDAVQKIGGGYFSAMTQADQDSSLAENNRKLIRAAVTTKAMDLYRQEGGAQKPEYYAQEAVDAFLGNRYKLISGGNSTVGGYLGTNRGGPSYILIPRHLNGRDLTDAEVNAAEVNRNKFLTPENLKVLGVMPPSGLNKTKIDPDQFYEMVSKEGRLVPYGSNLFVIQWRNRESNSYMNVFTGQKDRYGHPVPLTIPIERIVTPAAPNPNAPSLVDTAKAWWGVVTGQTPNVPPEKKPKPSRTPSEPVVPPGY